MLATTYVGPPRATGRSIALFVIAAATETRRVIGIEAGVFDLGDTDALLAAPWADQVTRVLVEIIFEHDHASAVELATAIDARVASLGRPRLWHGDDRASWAVVDAGLAAGHDVRVGLEDSLVDRDGNRAPSNPDQVKRILERPDRGR